MEGGHPVDFDLEIVSDNTTYTFEGKEVPIIVVKAMGNIVLGEEKHRVEKEIYYAQDGRIYQKTIKYINDKESAVSILDYRECFAPGAPPHGYGKAPEKAVPKTQQSASEKPADKK